MAGSDVFSPSDTTTPIHLRCSSFDQILNEQQMTLCRQHNKLLSTTAIGTLQALNQCQRFFRNRAWNCSVFDSTTHYLGRFIDNCMPSYIAQYHVTKSAEKTCRYIQLASQFATSISASEQ